VSADAASDAFRRNVLLGTALVVVIGVATLVAWARFEAEAESMWCTAAGVMDTPVRDSPEAAFDAWWEVDGPDDAASAVNYDYTMSEVDPPSKREFERVSRTDWHWYAGGGNGVKVSAYETEGGWAVGGVNGCRSGKV
jgi:hypothetical protein